MVDFLTKIQYNLKMERSPFAEFSDTTPHKYEEALLSAGEEFPALIKRISNKISPEQKIALTAIDTDEFNPDFSYPSLWDLSPDDILNKREIIQNNLEIMHEMELGGYTPTISNEFDKDKALKGLLNLELLELTQMIQTTSDSLERQTYVDRFKKLNEIMTGPVDERLYQGLVNSLHDVADVINDNQPIAKRITVELTAKLPDRQGEDRIITLPEDIFAQYQNAYESIFGNWLREIIPKKDGLYSAEDMAQVFDNAIKSMKLDQEGWMVVLDPDVTSMKMSMEEKTISMPTERKPLTYEEFAPKVVHETLHITRGWNGSYISRSAEHGLPDYLDAEEGLMSYGEEFISGKRQGNVTYVERYIGVGSMTGSLDSREKDFKDVYAIMWRTRLLLENTERLACGEDVTKADVSKSKEDSLMNAQRLFRGGDGKTPGLGWTKDKSYYEGTAKLTSFLSTFPAKFGMENIHWLFAAKFDPTNDKHNQYLGLPLYKPASLAAS